MMARQLKIAVRIRLLCRLLLAFPEFPLRFASDEWSGSGIIIFRHYLSGFFGYR